MGKHRCAGNIHFFRKFCLQNGPRIRLGDKERAVARSTKGTVGCSQTARRAHHRNGSAGRACRPVAECLAACQRDQDTGFFFGLRSMSSKGMDARLNRAISQKSSI